MGAFRAGCGGTTPQREPQRHGFGLRVTVFSRNTPAFAARWPHLGREKWVTLQDGDIRYFTELPRDVRYVIHAAALTDRRVFASHPSAVAETNTVGTLRILRAATLLEDLQKVVLLSSGLVYGAQPWDQPRINEDFGGVLKCNDVNAVYPESKRLAEVMAQCAISESKLPVVTLRPFAFVGPYQSLQLPWAVTDFIRDSFRGGPIRIMGDGATVRSIMYYSDFACGVLLALAAGKPRTTYNLGSDEPVDLLTLAQKITKYFSPVPEIKLRLGQAGHDRNHGHHLRPHAFDRAFHHGFVEISGARRTSRCAATRLRGLPSVVQIYQHHHSGFGGDAKNPIGPCKR